MSRHAAVPPRAERLAHALSEELAKFPRRPASCQACGAFGLDRTSGRRWIECDADDRPTKIVVILCAECSDRLVEKHPRLYLAEDWWEGRAGAIDACLGCRFLDFADLRCMHRRLKANGGEGLPMHVYKRSLGLVCGGRSRGGCQPLIEYRAAPECLAKELAL